LADEHQRECANDFDNDVATRLSRLPEKAREDNFQRYEDEEYQ
jgi:hypothetical protein